MGIVEKFRAKEAEKTKGLGKPEEVQGPTINEILADDEQSKLFGLYMSEEKDKELGTRIAENKLKDTDFDVLFDRRKGFLELLERTKKIEKGLTGETIDAAISSSPELQKIATLFGKESIRTSIMNRLPEMVIKDRGRFALMEKISENLLATKESTTLVDENVKRLCGNYGMSEEEYAGVLHNPDPDALEDLLSQKMGIFRKLYSQYISGTYEEQMERRIKEMDTSSAVRDAAKEVDRHQAALIGLLRGTISDNEMVRENLGAIMRSEELPRGIAEKPSFSEVKALKKEPFNKKELEEGWEKYKKQHQADKGFDEKKSRTAYSEGYVMDNIFKDKSKRGGFWVNVFKYMYIGAIEDILK